MSRTSSRPQPQRWWGARSPGENKGSQEKSERQRERKGMERRELRNSSYLRTGVCKRVNKGTINSIYRSRVFLPKEALCQLRSQMCTPYRALRPMWGETEGKNHEGNHRKRQGRSIMGKQKHKTYIVGCSKRPLCGI